MIDSIALARSQWLTLAVDYATTHTAHARRQLAVHFDQLADERADSYFRGMADAVRLAKTFITAATPQIWN